MTTEKQRQLRKISASVQTRESLPTQISALAIVPSDGGSLRLPLR